MLNDLRYAFRMLLKNPGFTVVAVLTLALGIGANTGIFSVVNSVLLKPLPYPAPQRIVMLWTDNPSLNLGFHELPATPPDLLEWRSQAQSFEQIAAFRTRFADLSEQGDPERVGSVQASANFFSFLGAQPMLGRVFTGDDERPGNDKIAVISHSLWQRCFGGDPNVIGQFITINRERHTIVGVMNPGFNFPHGAEMPAGYALMPQTEVWRPYADTAEYWRNDDMRDFIAMGRLKPGVALGQAQAEMTGFAQREAERYPKTHTGWTIRLRPFALQIAGKTRPVLFVLLGAVAFVLLIACANVANLLLCRSAARRKEMAVRAAIGAGRGRIVRQLLTESVLLAALGGAIGLLLGAWGVQVILGFSPSNIPRLHETTLDGTVFLFSLVLSLATVVIFGLAPAWKASKVNLSQALNADGRSGTAAGRTRTLGSLVIAEVALALILLTGAGLMVQSFLRLAAVDTGFKPQRIAVFDVTLRGERYNTSVRRHEFYRETRKRLATIPGVSAAAAISNLPLGEMESLNYFFVEGAPPQPAGKAPFAENRKITPEYFDTMGVQLLRGRDFTDKDTQEQPRVCIINETIVRTCFSGSEPIGKRLKIGGEQQPWLTIVGVAADVRSYGLEAKPRPQVYAPIEQNPDIDMSFIVRTASTPPASLEGIVRAEMKTLDPALPLINFRTMESLVANALARPRLGTLLLGLFAVTALLLTVVGLYGVVAYATSQRSREIGIRIALGAQHTDILRLLIRQGMTPVVIGIAAGLLGAIVLTRIMAGLLFGVSAGDPATFAGVTALLASIALLACWLPARRAAKVDPTVALRAE